MRIDSIEWKNFNSYGNFIQRIDFNNIGELYLLTGSNGHGKSTISEVITFALYGRVERKNKSDLPNRINKNLFVRIRLRTKNKNVIITRGVSPGVFEVDIDGVPYDTSGINNVQEYLERELFEIPYQVFKNIIVLSVNDFRSFLTMSPGDKRNIIDRLFGFTIINEMRDRVKNERRDIKDALKTISDELNIINESIDSISDRIKNIEKTKKVDTKKLISELNEKVAELRVKRDKLENSLILIEKTKSKLDLVLSETRKNASKIKFQYEDCIKDLELYKMSTCPTCKSPLDTEKHKEIESGLRVVKSELEESLKVIKGDVESTNKKLNLIIERREEVSKNILTQKMLVNQYLNEIEKLSKDDNLNVKHLRDLIKENEEKKSQRNTAKGKKSIEDGFLEIVESILGDGGVKNLAMKTILPSLNQNIHNMANQIHLPYMIKFDEKFNCNITSIGESINPKSMSTGERKKADFIIIIAMLKILKIRYPSLNLLFLDEIFSSVDSPGIYEIIKILNDVSKENNLNVWVINHTELPTELFDKRVEAVKEGGFSKLLLEVIS